MRTLIAAFFAAALMAAATMVAADPREAVVAASIARYEGQCPCPYSVMRNGKACGERSSWSMKGKRAPLCYVNEVDGAGAGVTGLMNSGNAADSGLVGRASVVDGDTLEVRGKRVRLVAIDAFESSQTCALHGRPYRCGQEGALWLSNLIGERNVRCEVTGQDRYQRALAICFLGDIDLNGAMVEAGHALAYQSFSTRYVMLEAQARVARVGVWRDGVTFEPPWDFRRRQQ
jgi:endonuclease YncB( thermonuclease family)